MKTSSPLLLSSVGVMALTILHHAYGAIIYEAPFRLHVVYMAIPVIFILLLTHRAYRRRSPAGSGKVALWVFMAVTLLFPIGVVSIFEGGYNHLVKNVLFFSGASHELLTRLFPPPTYEMPDDFWFEATGILQFFTGVYCLYRLIRFKMRT